MRITSGFTGDRQAVASLKRLGSEGLKAMTRATNKAGDKARTLSSREIREDVSLSAAYVRQRLRVRRATFSRLEYTIQTPKRGVLMTRYPYRELSRGGRPNGVSVKIKRRGARAKLRSGFVTWLTAGQKKVQAIAVPERSKSGGKRPRYKTGNSKIKVLYAPSISQVYDSVRGRITPEVLRYFEGQVLRELIQAEKKAGLR